MLHALATCKTWTALREHTILRAAFASLPEPKAAETIEVPASLQKLCSLALLGRTRSFAHSTQLLHTQVGELGDDDRRACVPYDLAIIFATRVTRWISAIRADSPRRRSDGSRACDPSQLDPDFKTALLAADVLSRLLHRLEGSSIADLDPLAAARLKLVSWLTTWLTTTMEKSAAEDEVLAAWLPAVDGTKLHPSTCAMLNAQRLEASAFDPLFHMVSWVPMDRLDVSLEPDAEALRQRKGLEVWFPGDERESPPTSERRQCRVLGGTWLCKLATEEEPEPVCFELLLTSAIMRGHAPRVRFRPPIDNPLVHPATGLLSPLALEHMGKWMGRGVVSLVTPATIVDFVQMILSFTPARQLPAGLVEQCAVDVDSLAKYLEGPRAKRMRS